MSEFSELRVGDHISFLSGFPFSSGYFDQHEGIRLIRIRDLLDSEGDKIYYRGPFDSKWLIKERDILIGMDGDFNIVRWREDDALLNQRILKVEANPSSSIDKNFFFYWCEPFLIKIHNRTAATTVKHLSVRDIEKTKNLFPRKVEQQRIAEILGTIDQAIEQTESLIAKCQQIKAGLMHDLFTRGITPDGQLRPKREDAPQLYKQSPLGWIPKEWELKPCSAICEKITVGIVVRPTQYYVSEGIPAFRSANVREWGIDATDFVYITPQANNMLAKSQLKAGDVISVRTGYPGTSAVVPDEFAGANCIDLLISRPSAEVRSNYFSQWINSSFGKDQVLQKQGGLAQQHFNVGEIRNLLVALPKLNEQDAMIDRLAMATRKIESEQLFTAKLRSQKQGLMQDLLTGRVRTNISPTTKN